MKKKYFSNTQRKNKLTIKKLFFQNILKKY